MRYLLLFVPVLFFSISNTVNAADYYYCECAAGASSQCVEGLDSNSGATALLPRKTFSHAANTFSNFQPGDSIMFCRGGSFSANAKISWVNNQCTAASNCGVASYDLPGQQASSLPRPIVTQFSNSSLFALDDSGNADHEEGYSFSNLDLRCPGCLASGAGYGFFLYNDVDFVTIDNISFDNFRIGVHLAGSNPANAGSDGVLDNIILSNLNITNSKSQGMLGGANNLEISNSYFQNNGSGTNRDHNVYISRGDGIVIRGNELYQSSLDANGNCAGVPLVVHGTINNLLIENNIVREDIGKAGPGCWGIAVDPGYSKAEAFTNITIKNNEVINVGNIAIGVASCDNCVIENNVILQQQSFRSIAIRAPDRNRAADDRALNRITIRNNSIYTSSTGTGIELGSEGSGHIVVSNAIHYTGSGRYTCFNLGLTASVYTAVDNNICNFPNALATSEWEAGSGTTPTPLAAWQGLMGFGTSSSNVNPAFKSPGLPLLDMSALNNSSAMVNSGHTTLSAVNDFSGKARDTNPDIGAFEFELFNPPAKTTVFFN